MNASIIMLQDGKTPCIVHDAPLPHAIDYVEFNPADFRLTLVYKDARAPGASKFSAARHGHRFDFPLDHKYVALLEELKYVGVAEARDNKLLDFAIYSVKFAR